MKPFLFIIIATLISACGSPYEGAGTPNLRGGGLGGGSSDCKEYEKVVCTMEYSPHLCSATYNNELIEAEGGNPCGAKASFKKAACELGFTDAQIQKMRPSCEFTSL